MDACHDAALNIDPLRPPDWRWQSACGLLSKAGRRRRRSYDPDWLPTLLALAGTVYPSGRLPWDPVPLEVMRAFELYEGRTQLRWELEARLLARQTNEDISAATAIPAAVVAEYEPTFFDVRDRLAAGDYILFAVIGYAPYRGFDEGDLRAIWSYFAYAAGPKMLELVMAVSLGRSLPEWALSEAPSGADVELLRIGVKMMLMGSTGAMTPSKLRKLRILRMQMAELRRKAPPKELETIVNATGLSERQSPCDIADRAAEHTNSPETAVCEGEPASSPKLAEVA